MMASRTFRITVVITKPSTHVTRTATNWIQSCLGLPYSSPSPPPSLTSLVAKTPVARAPDAVHAHHVERVVVAEPRLQVASGVADHPRDGSDQDGGHRGHEAGGGG